MCRPTIAVSAALLASLAVLYLLTELAETQTALTGTSASVDGDSLTITLSAAVDASSTADASDFTISAGDEELTVDSADVDGATITLTLAQSVDDPDCDSTAIIVSYEQSESSITASGTELSDFADFSVTNQTDKAPAITSIETDATGRYIYLTFCETIATGENGWLTIAAFAANINGSSEPINDVTIGSSNSKRLEIQFGSTAISEGDTVTVTYDRGNADDGDPPQDADQGGKLIESWSAREVTNKVDSPPSLVSVTALWDVITLTYSEALDEDSVPDKSAFTISNRPYSVTINSVAVSGKTVSLGVSAVIRGELDPKFQLSYVAPSESPLQQEDGAKQAGDFDSETVVSSTPTKKPAVVSAEVSGATLTITFDMPLKSVAGSAAFTVSGAAGVSVSNASFSGSVVTLTLSTAVSSGDSLTVSYEKPDGTPRIEARNNRDADSFSNQTATNNTPSLTPTFVSASINAAGDTLSITMSGDLLETAIGQPAASAFTLSGGSAAVSAVSVSGTTVALSLSPKADLGETITVAYTQPTGAMNGKLQSLTGGHLVSSWSAESLTNNADGVPRPASASVNGATLVIGFDRTLDAMSKPAASTFTLSGTTVTVSSLGIADSTITLTLSAAVAHDDVVTITYEKPETGGVKRSGQALFVESFTSLEVTNQTSDPTPTFVSASINAAGDVLSITMSADLLETSAAVPAASTFTLSGSTAVVSAVSVSGTTVTLTLSPKADLGETITAAYAQPTGATDGKLQSLTGGHLVSSWSAESVTNNADGVPRPASASVNGATLVIGFDRTLDSASKPAASAFTLGGTTATVSTVSISGTNVTLTLGASVAHDDVITITYDKPETDGVKRSGRALFVESFSDLDVTNETSEPLIRSVVGDEDEIAIAVSKPLETDSKPAASAFSLGEGHPTVSEVSLETMTIRLELSSSLREGMAYTLMYTAPSESPLTTSDAVAVDSFSRAATNETDVAPLVKSATVNGATVSLIFDQALDGDSALGAAAFTITASPSASVTAVSYDGDNGLDLTLSRSLVEGESATLGYARPSSAGIADPGGKRTVSFSVALDNQTDTAPEPASGTVTDDEIVIVLDQDIFDDPRFHDEDGYPTAHFTLTGTDATVAFVQVSNGGTGGVGKIVITLSEDVDELETVRVRYFPSTGTIRIREDEDGERRAEINNYQLKNLTRTAPSLFSATLDGTALSLVFDRALDEDAAVEAAWFSFASAGLSVESAELSGTAVSLVVSPKAIEDAEYTLTYTPPETGGVASASGVLAATFTDDVTNVTDTAPVPVSAGAEATGQMPGANQITLRFDQRLDPPGSVDTSWFTLSPALEIKRLAIDATRTEGDQLLIELEAGHWVRESASVNLTYKQPETSGLRDDDGDPEVEGDDGNRVADFTIAVQNNVDVAPRLTGATVNRHLIELKFDQALDSDEEYIPPPNCEWLEAKVAEFDCATAGYPTWFTVARTRNGSTSSETASIADVSVSGNVVTLRLDERTNHGDSVELTYQVQSVDGAKWNLRDTTQPENIVDSIQSIDVTNVTAAAPTGKTFDRAEPSKIIVAFDGALRENADLNTDPLRVTADDEPLPVRQASASQEQLTVNLQRAVPECAELVIAYSPGEHAWLDERGYTVDAFNVGLSNLIESTHGLACIESDIGALALTFVTEAEPSEDGWSLEVNGESRQLRVERSTESLTLVPNAAVCVGDTLTISWMSSDESPALSLQRVVERAAPCADSAVAVGDRLELTFDQPLDASLPTPDDFAIERGGQVTGIVGIEGRTLTLQLEPPGLDADVDAVLTYAGSSLRGGGLTVGPLSVPITDQTSPPELTTAFGLDDLIILSFDQPLQQRNVPVSWFELAGPGLDIDIATVSISGSSVYLQLKRSLPDDLDLFGVVYIARGRQGLAGVSGALVRNGVFVVQNYTETAPQVVSVSVNRQEAVLTFNQRIDAANAQTADFAVLAGHRRIGVSSLDWSNETITLILTEPVTSLDATRVIHSPRTEKTVRDLSGLPLAAFDMVAENLTPSARTEAQIVEEARLRADGGATLVERELARAFASVDGARFAALPGDGGATVVQGGMRVTVELAHWSEGKVGISLSRLSSAPRLMRLLDQVPSACANAPTGSRVGAWLLELQDQRGRPRLAGVGVTLGGLEAARLLGGCVLDLITETWTLMPLDGKVTAPSLILPGASTWFTTWVSLSPGA